jgi:hypothetical protein
MIPLGSEKLQAYSKPWIAETSSSRRGHCCSIRPDNVPVLKIKSDINGGNKFSEFMNKSTGGLLGFIQSDLDHYGNILHDQMNRSARALQRSLLFPTCHPEQDELAEEKIFLYNAMGYKLLPALGVFHVKGAEILSTGHTRSRDNTPSL